MLRKNDVLLEVVRVMCFSSGVGEEVGGGTGEAEGSAGEEGSEGTT